MTKSNLLRVEEGKLRLREEVRLVPRSHNKLL